MPLEPNSSLRGSETILLVDSDPETRKLALFMLEKQGYTVLEARNGVEARALLDKHASEVSLLVAEVRGRGHQLAAMLKEIQETPPVLYMSDSETGEAVRSIVEQRLPLLKKPFTMRDIAGAVRHTLDNSHAKVMTAGASFS